MAVEEDLLQEPGAQPEEEAGTLDFITGGGKGWFWPVFAQVWGVAQSYGWYVFFIVVALVVLWPTLGPKWNEFIRNLGSPRKEVLADESAVMAARARQQQRVLQESKERKLAQEVKKREELLAAADGKNKAKKKPRPPPDYDFGSKDLPLMGRGGGGSSYRPSRRRAAGGG